MYYYEDCYDNQSEADAIIEEATDKLREIIVQPIKDRLKYINEWEDKYYKKDANLAKLQQELEKQRQALEKEKQEWNSEKENKPIEFINTITDKVCKGLKIGQKVWRIKSNYYNIPCPKCNGTRKIQVKYFDGQIVEEKCSCCDGKKTTVSYEIVEDYIEEIKLYLSIDEKTINIYTRGDSDYSFGYVFLKEFGQCDINNVFATPEKAQAEVDRRNSKQNS